MTDKLRALLARLKASIAAIRVTVLTQLNVLGTGLLVYVMEHPTAPAELLEAIPESFRGTARIALPIVWLVLIQYAIGHLKKKAGTAPADPGAVQ